MKAYCVICAAPFLLLGSCSNPPAPAVDLKGLALFQVQGVGDIRGSISWKTWALMDGTGWIQRVESTRDLKPKESAHSPGAVWECRITRWHFTLPDGWWNEAERLATKHRFFEQSEQVRDPGPFLAGADLPTILAVSQAGTSRRVSKWDVDQVPDFDPLFEHLKILSKQLDGVNPEYEGTADTASRDEVADAWQPSEFHAVPVR